MKSTDRFLILIVGGVLLLVAVAFVMVLRRPPSTFATEDTASSVAHNYLLALQQRDFARAYGYLSPSLKGYPGSLEQFTADLRSRYYRFPLDDSSVALEIESSRPLGSAVETEEVVVRETRFNERGLFGGGQYSSAFKMELQRERAGWKIVASDEYFAYCWTTKERGGCN